MKITIIKIFSVFSLIIIISNNIYAKYDTIISNNFTNIQSSKSVDITIIKIQIFGNNRTKKDIILRELSIKEGDKIAIDKIISILNEEERKIVNTDLFNEVEFKIEITKENQLIVIINVLESIYWRPIILFELSDRNFNDWWENFNHDLNRINYGLGFAHYNISGRADEFEILLRLGFIKQFQTSYFIPYISKKQKGGIEIEFDYIDYNHLEYNSIDYVPIF